MLMCLALNGYHEARGEPTAGELAVNHVVMNRVADHRYKNNVCDVVKAGRYRNNQPIKHACHFSWWCDGKSDNPRDLDAWLYSNQLVPIETPANFETHDLRDPKVYGLLNELQIKLLLLT